MKCDNSMNWQICRGKSLLKTENQLLIEYLGGINILQKVTCQSALPKCSFAKWPSIKMTDRRYTRFNPDGVWVRIERGFLAYIYSVSALYLH
jgi:hypothetical protein